MIRKFIELRRLEGPDTLVWTTPKVSVDLLDVVAVSNEERVSKIDGTTIPRTKIFLSGGAELFVAEDYAVIQEAIRMAQFFAEKK